MAGAATEAGAAEHAAQDAVVPGSHPRAESLRMRHRLVRGFEDGLVAAEGLLAHGRGEALDYLLGEETGGAARQACRAAAAALCSSDRPVISVNGNAAALCAGQLVSLAECTGSALEVNLFYDSPGRRGAIAGRLRRHGAKRVLGLDPERMAVLHGTDSARRMVDRDGIFAADTVVVPLEDGDRTAALKRAGKTVITFDLNPLSRTAQAADISIIDNITRAISVLLEECRDLAGEDGGDGRSGRGGGAKPTAAARIARNFDNEGNLAQAVRQITGNLGRLQGMRAAASGGDGAAATAATAPAAITAHGPRPE
ncbi:MAG: phosphopantothenate/pantothenate synthetase [Thaumarchaeota archaeon]|nr:phosphopantothenate/pantothenate synthetase [Nitrososphaerota archaeon]